MKTIGLIGGMSWVSTSHDYRHINESVASQLGGDHCARMVLWQEDFDVVTAMQRSGDWDAAGRLLSNGSLPSQRRSWAAVPNASCWRVRSMRWC